MEHLAAEAHTDQPEGVQCNILHRQICTHALTCTWPTYKGKCASASLLSLTKETVTAEIKQRVSRCGGRRNTTVGVTLVSSSVLSKRFILCLMTADGNHSLLFVMQRRAVTQRPPVLSHAKACPLPGSPSFVSRLTEKD